LQDGSGENGCISGVVKQNIAILYNLMLQKHRGHKRDNIVQQTTRPPISEHPIKV
jgi:hypothetical protein